MKDDITNKTVKPFLRWVGGKRWLINKVDHLIPKEINNYFEPFLGGGAMFIHLIQNKKIKEISFLSDINTDLINSYEMIKQNPEELIKELKRYKNEKDFYYEERKKKHRIDLKRASQFIYLNRTSFNGIYRENLKGEYNVPYGNKNYKKLFEFDNLKQLSTLFANSEFSSNDFDNIKNKVKKGDFVFLDPPYTVVHSLNGFIKYNQKLFSWEDQIRLKDLVLFLEKENINFILSNAYHQSIDDLYDSSVSLKRILERASVVGGKNAIRQKYKEILISNLK